MSKKIFRKNRSYKKLITIGVLASAVIGGYFILPRIESTLCCLGDTLIDISGFKIKRIEISGASPKVSKLIRKKLQLSENNDSIFKKSSREIYTNVEKVSWVKSAIVRKNLPNIVKIDIVEAVPIAVFQHDAKSILIDGDGVFIEEVTEKPAGLPLISGLNANMKARQILDTISKFNEVNSRLETLSFVRERRWDISVSGIKIKLPEKDLEKALEVLTIILKSEKFNKNTIRLIDLRIPDSVIMNGLKIKKALSV